MRKRKGKEKIEIFLKEKTKLQVERVMKGGKYNCERITEKHHKKIGQKENGQKKENKRIKKKTKWLNISHSDQ